MANDKYNEEKCYCKELYKIPNESEFKCKKDWCGRWRIMNRKNKEDKSS